jgi:pyruvate/2-oxoglutarate/acetoin dehydrogenase E1 component
MSTGATQLKAALQAHATSPEGVVVGEAVGVAGLAAGITGHLVRTPLSEAAAVGVAVGLALAGKRPVVELMDVKGVSRAAEALADAASLPGRSAGAFKVGVVVLAPLPLEAELPSIPRGIALAVAATAGDAAGLLQAALADGGPVLLLLSDEALAGREAGDVAALGRPVVRREGRGAVVLAEGAGVAVALAGAGEATVVDLRGCRDAPLLGSLVAPTGRVVVVTHSADTALLAVLAGAFWRLEAPPTFVHPRAGVAALSAALLDALTP